MKGRPLVHLPFPFHLPQLPYPTIESPVTMGEGRKQQAKDVLAAAVPNLHAGDLGPVVIWC